MSTLDIATTYRDTGWKTYTANNAETPCALTADIRFIQRMQRGPIHMMMRTGTTVAVAATGANKFWKFSNCVPAWASVTTLTNNKLAQIPVFVQGGINVTGHVFIQSPHVVVYVEGDVAATDRQAVDVPAGWAGLTCFLGTTDLGYMLDDPV